MLLALLVLLTGVLVAGPVLRATASTSHSPYGHTDTFPRVSGGIMATGWAIDPDAPTRPLTVYTTIDG